MVPFLHSPAIEKVMMGRNQVRNKQMMHHNAAKTENGVNESFEDLLTKYKQIQLELECIRKEENLVLKPEEDLWALNEPEVSAGNPQTEPLPDTNSIPNDSAAEEKKVFQAFNLKPLRQKLLTPAEIDALKTKTEKKDPEKEDSDVESERGPVEPVATPFSIPKGVYQSHDTTQVCSNGYRGGN